MKNKIEFETFRSLGSYEINNLTSKEYSCFNGNVTIHKYKITIEQIEESKEVLCERVQDLWDKCDNHHHWQPLKDMAKKLDYVFPNNPGSKRNK